MNFSDLSVFGYVCAISPYFLYIAFPFYRHTGERKIRLIFTDTAKADRVRTYCFLRRFLEVRGVGKRNKSRHVTWRAWFVLGNDVRNILFVLFICSTKQHVYVLATLLWLISFILCNWSNFPGFLFLFQFQELLQTFNIQANVAVILFQSYPHHTHKAKPFPTKYSFKHYATNGRKNAHFQYSNKASAFIMPRCVCLSQHDRPGALRWPTLLLSEIDFRAIYGLRRVLASWMWSGLVNSSNQQKMERLQTKICLQISSRSCPMMSNDSLLWVCVWPWC